MPLSHEELRLRGHIAELEEQILQWHYQIAHAVGCLPQESRRVILDRAKQDRQAVARLEAENARLRAELAAAKEGR
jgi:hypothetical protein